MNFHVDHKPTAQDKIEDIFDNLEFITLQRIAQKCKQLDDMKVSKNG